MENNTDPETIRYIARSNLCKYTRKAFYSLPKLENPHILDIGCGSGVPTVELTKLCDCRIVALDNDSSQLKLLERKLKEQGLTDRVEVLNQSITDMNFNAESFDIIWSEGSIFVVGFKRGLEEWRHFLKPGGFMVVHDEREDVEEKLKFIVHNGYRLLDYFILDRDIWWREYCSPLESELQKIRERYPDRPEFLKKFKKEQGEIDLFKKNPGKFESVFFILQKIE
jgi:ubiquinone/menaquinone biosynthesis C-methylase UbiE